MSLVGTRPPTLDEWEKYEPHHRARMSFRPGLTGLWQVSGRSNITDFEEVVRLDTQYIGEWSVKWDIKIIWQTAVLSGVIYLRHYVETPAQSGVMLMNCLTSSCKGWRLLSTVLPPAQLSGSEAVC